MRLPTCDHAVGARFRLQTGANRMFDGEGAPQE